MSEQNIQIPATDHVFAFGVAYATIGPASMSHIEVKIAANGTSIELTPWSRQETTNFVLQMNKEVAIAVGNALLKLAERTSE